MLGIELTDHDVLNVPLLAPTPTAISFRRERLCPGHHRRRRGRHPEYGRRRRARRQPGVTGRHAVPSALRTGHAFLNDIAHQRQSGVDSQTGAASLTR